MNNLNEKLILEEYRQRYEQYRMHNENRNKYIHFYFIFYFAFWALVGFSFKPEIKCFLNRYSISIETFLSFVFIMHAIFGSIFLLSLISFRQIQNREGETINMIRKCSSNNFIVNQLKYPLDRNIPCLGFIFTSQTPLVLLIFIMNLFSFLLYIWFSRFSLGICTTVWANAILSCLLAFQILIWIFIAIFILFWGPTTKSLVEINKILNNNLRKLIRRYLCPFEKNE